MEQGVCCDGCFCLWFCVVVLSWIWLWGRGLWCFCFLFASLFSKFSIIIFMTIAHCYVQVSWCGLYNPNDVFLFSLFIFGLCFRTYICLNHFSFFELQPLYFCFLMQFDLYVLFCSNLSLVLTSLFLFDHEVRCDGIQGFCFNLLLVYASSSRAFS